MKSWIKPVTFAALLLLAAAAAEAQSAGQGDGDDDNVTMKLITDPSADLPDVVTQDIVLPDGASAKAVEKSAHGLATANAARAKDHPGGNGDGEDEQDDSQDAPQQDVSAEVSDHAQQGQDTAAEARADGEAFGAETAAAARDLAETNASAIAESAQENREGLGRSTTGDLPDVPHADLPDQATVPDVSAPVSPPGLGH